MINMERRKRVMQRSIRLGHCICDPKKPCPCDLFKEKDICLCAGERLEAPAGEVKLTQLVEKAGCASKIDQAFLKQVLKDLPAVDDPRVALELRLGNPLRGERAQLLVDLEREPQPVGIPFPADEALPVGLKPHPVFLPHPPATPADAMNVHSPP